MKKGNSYFDSKEYKKAIDFYDQALKIDPKYTNALYNSYNALFKNVIIKDKKQKNIDEFNTSNNREDIEIKTKEEELYKKEKANSKQMETLANNVELLETQIQDLPLDIQNLTSDSAKIKIATDKPPEPLPPPLPPKPPIKLPLANDDLFADN